MSVIRAGDGAVAAINTFYVKPGKADVLLTTLIDATIRVIAHQPGFISANLHVSLDETRVINYAQWRSRNDYEMMRANPDVVPHMRRASELAERFDPILTEVAYVEDHPA